MALTPFAATCAEEGPDNMANELSSRAREIAEASIIIDGHQDVPYRLHGNWADISGATTDGNFDYLTELVGVDHVGIGTDYDGVGDTLPIGLKDVSSYPVLIQGFLNRGYSDEDIKKILGENLLRVWAEVEKVAAELE